MNYSKVYQNLLSEHGSSKKNKGVYQERHHIKPKSIGGDDSPENLVYLSARVHFICHRLLCRIHADSNKLKFAFWSMCNQLNGDVKRDYKITSRVFQTAKENFVAANSLLHTGKTISQKQKDNCRKAMLGNTFRKKGKDSHLYGKSRSTATKEAISATKLKNPENNGQFKGYYVTPEGTFASVPLAVKNTKYSAGCIRNCCKNSDKVVNRRMLVNTKHFGPQQVGLRLKDLGWGFLPAP